MARLKYKIVTLRARESFLQKADIVDWSRVSDEHLWIALCLIKNKFESVRPRMVREREKDVQRDQSLLRA